MDVALVISGQQHSSDLCKPGNKLLASFVSFCSTCVKLPVPWLTSRSKEPPTVCTSTSMDVRLLDLLIEFSRSTKNLENKDVTLNDPIEDNVLT